MGPQTIAMMKDDRTRYVQVRDLIERVRALHSDLAAYYHQLSDRAEQARLRLLLDYLSTHEENLQESLADYEDEGAASVLDTWVDRRHSEDLIAACAALPEEPDMSLDSITHIAFDVDACLMRFYRDLSQKADSEEVRETFRDLLASEEAELRRLARNALTSADI